MDKVVFYSFVIPILELGPPGLPGSCTSSTAHSPCAARNSYSRALTVCMAWTKSVPERELPAVTSECEELRSVCPIRSYIPSRSPS